MARRINNEAELITEEIERCRKYVEDEQRVFKEGKETLIMSNWGNDKWDEKKKQLLQQITSELWWTKSKNKKLWNSNEWSNDGV